MEHTLNIETHFKYFKSVNGSKFDVELTCNKIILNNEKYAVHVWVDGYLVNSIRLPIPNDYYDSDISLEEFNEYNNSSLIKSACEFIYLQSIL
jgi:hypothetical protein